MDCKVSNKHIKTEVYIVLIFMAIIATLFMCIAYAQVSGILVNVTGSLDTMVQNGVFITSVDNISEEETGSETNYFIQTMLDCKIILKNNDEASTQTYQISLYNNSNKQHVFIDVLTDVQDENLYDNKNIEFYITGMEKHITIIDPGETLQFNITFKFKLESDLSYNILNCKLNFRFKENPKIALSNEGQSYKLNNFCPDYTPQQYEFSVMNYIGEVINTIPINYYFDINIDKPLSAKIYDEYNHEFVESVEFFGNEEEKKEHNYTLKVFWDDSNEEDGVEYNSSKYENKEFLCIVKLIAEVNDEKYLDFSIIKKFDVVINSDDYKDSCSITYVDITNYNYSTQVAKGENIEITFVNEIPPVVQVTGAESYTYNKPVLSIYNAQDDLVITNPTGELIAFEYENDYVFTGNNYINTGTKLFNEENIARDFIISFEIKEDNQGQTQYGTILSIMNESGAPYPGFVYRVGSNNRITEYEFTANSFDKKGKAYYTSRETTSKVEIFRINKILYVRINEGKVEQMQDYTEFTNYFDVPVTFGAGLNSSGKPFRYFKGVLSNLKMKFVSNGELLNLINVSV